MTNILANSLLTYDDNDELVERDRDDGSIVQSLAAVADDVQHIAQQGINLLVLGVSGDAISQYGPDGSSIGDLVSSANVGSKIVYAYTRGALLCDESGRVVLIDTPNSSGGGSDFRAHRWLADGTFDQSFTLAFQGDNVAPVRGAALSRDGQYLYVVSATTDINDIVRYDLNNAGSADILASVGPVPSAEYHGGIIALDDGSIWASVQQYQDGMGGGSEDQYRYYLYGYSSDGSPIDSYLYAQTAVSFGASPHGSNRYIGGDPDSTHVFVYDYDADLNETAIYRFSLADETFDTIIADVGYSIGGALDPGTVPLIVWRLITGGLALYASDGTRTWLKTSGFGGA